MRVDDLCQELESLAARAPAPAHDASGAVRRGRARRSRAALLRAAAAVTVGAVVVFGVVRIERDPQRDLLRTGPPASRPSNPHPAGDPLGGHALPPRGLIVLDSPRNNGQKPASWSIALLNDEGSLLAQLPRATIGNAVINAVWNTSVVADNAAVSIQHAPLDEGDAPAGCTITVAEPRPVALCGTRSGDQLLGTRIMIDGPGGWSTLVGTPPLVGGRQALGHWSWATPSPDGLWVLAQWSGECESQTGMLISVTDGSLHAITGEAGTAWADAPASEILGWNSSGQAIYQLESSCDAAARAPGIYAVTPANGSRHLLRALSSTALVLRWTVLSDIRKTASGAHPNHVRELGCSDSQPVSVTLRLPDIPSGDLQIAVVNRDGENETTIYWERTAIDDSTRSGVDENFDVPGPTCPGNSQTMTIWLDRAPPATDLRATIPLALPAPGSNGVSTLTLTPTLH